MARQVTQKRNAARQRNEERNRVPREADERARGVDGDAQEQVHANRRQRDDGDDRLFRVDQGTRLSHLPASHCRVARGHRRSGTPRLSAAP